MWVNEVRRAPLFAPLPVDALAALALVVRSADYHRGEQLRGPGEASADLTVVLAGFVRLFRPQSDGAEVTTGIVRPGGLLTAAPLSGLARLDHHAEALSRVRTLGAPMVEFLAIGARWPLLLAQLATCLTTRIDDAYAAAAASARVPTRVLRVLRCLAQTEACVESAVGAGMRRLIPLSHAELARLVNADRATVTRALGELEARGLIGQVRGHIVGVRIPADRASMREGRRRP